ncbi:MULTISPECIES: helix-turn-helix domain-containing protein [unclassified Oceanispirochaeta]|uniref:helix-turn-helix domain-containing protein n=1 Tax=unclassified Oceanispirochaeta TaxID=2635722 RepID=UPI0013148260|nr:MULTISPECIES: helix-turn-helix domain-containing protein [unclassified Oceanispirochaeta]MBF9018991.1 helix-turn-helix domain-containing protein [Oceanispirochaeta sp. M2]NPD75491.1 helix-turn-helix domain-containing protein [Oceanispirochaeta sp. M1]
MKQPEIGKVVTHLRLQKGMTQETLGELCEVSTRTIQRIESGEVDPRTFTLNNLSNILEYDFNNDNKGNESFWITVLHLSSMICIVPIPLLIWSFRKKYSLKIDKHGKDVINFQISMTLYLIACAILPGVTSFLMIKYNNSMSFIISVISIIPLITLGFICFFQGLFNALKVLNSKSYRYLLSIPFLQ